MLELIVHLQALVVSAAHRRGPAPPGSRPLPPRLRGEAGQTTAEYALVMLGAAAIAALVVTWASKTDVGGQAVRLRRLEGDRRGLVRPGGAAGEGGQTTVELALALPLVAMSILLVVQIGLVVRDEVLVTHAAREAARAAAVSRDPAAAGQAARAAGPLDAGRLHVDVDRLASPDRARCGSGCAIAV